MSTSSNSFDPSTTTIAQAQGDMRFAYYGGAPGVLTSATVWLVAALVSLQVSPERAIWTLFVGGMLIHPVAVLLTKAIGRPGNHRRGNPLGSLALASTFWLVMSLPLAYVVSRFRIDWFFPAMLLVIGGRYLTFSTMFGTRLYWACGGALALAGYWLARTSATPTMGAFTGAAIEAFFAIMIFVAARREAAA
ncbi:DUF7010 family protein [Lysobacter fragariae]